MKFSFREFDIVQEASAMKVGTDSVLLGCLAEVSAAKHILDIGTGTGLLALMMAQRSAARIDAVELDATAYQEAVHNISVSKWNHRVQVFQSSIQSFASPHGYDLIITNPPYYPQGKQYVISNEQRRKARHGDDLSFDELILHVKRLLSPTGKLWLILPLNEGLTFREMALEKELYCVHEVQVRPKPDKEINRLIMAFSNEATEKQIDEMVIYKTNGEATEKYIQLTLPFYLWKHLDRDDRLKI